MLELGLVRPFTNQPVSVSQMVSQSASTALDPWAQTLLALLQAQAAKKRAKEDTEKHVVQLPSPVKGVRKRKSSEQHESDSDEDDDDDAVVSEDGDIKDEDESDQLLASGADVVSRSCCLLGYRWAGSATLCTLLW